MTLVAGAKLGPYEITGEVGAGGMGQVFKARDTRLDRTVAIKTSKKQFDERFEREARAVAALNHPHICTLHDVGPDYLVMEYVDGKPLRGPLLIDEALRYAAQIAGALDAAHRKGIIHRDLKPGNILVTKQGVKLLDFGLAKHVSEPPATNEQAATLTKALTGEGTILGTPQYMAPEQVEGKEADARTDIFAFGCVLYEMLTGRRAFDGKNHASVIAKILEGEPAPVRDLQPVTPPALERVLKTCLRKDPDERWQSAADLRHALDLVTAEPAATPASKRRWLWPAVTIVVGVLAVMAGWVARSPEPAPTYQFAVNAPEGTEYLSAGTNQGNSALSPDGTMLAFSARTKGTMQIWVRRLDSMQSRPLAGTEDGYYPFWSPDSRSIGFFTTDKLKRIEVSGGPAQTICDARPGRGGSWNSAGVVLFSAGSTGRVIMRVPAAGGMPAALTRLDESGQENAHYWPSFLPDGRHFLYLVRSANQEQSAIWVARLDAPADRKRLVTALSNAAYAPPAHGLPGAGFGHLLFTRERTLVAQPFDPSKLELKGDAAPVAEEIGYAANIALADFSVSANGVVVYGPGTGEQRRLVWRDRSGKQVAAIEDRGPVQLRLSPDGKRLAIVRGLANADIWVRDLERGTESRFTFDPNFDGNPVWSPAGDQIAYVSYATTGPRILRKLANGAGEAEVLRQVVARGTFLTDWSRDGRHILLSLSQTAPLSPDLVIMNLDGERKLVPFLATPFAEVGGRFSPDGRWIAYMSNDSGVMQVFVQQFEPGKPASGARWQVSTSGGNAPVWRGDGKELFYFAPDGKLMAVRCRTDGEVFQSDTPALLFETAAVAAGGFDVTRDGQRFVLSEPSEQERSQPMTVIVNWQAGLKK